MDIRTIRKVLRRYYTMNTVQALQPRQVNIADSRMRVRASQDTGMK
jgi:hypothetical protein